MLLLTLTSHRGTYYTLGLNTVCQQLSIVILDNNICGTTCNNVQHPITHNQHYQLTSGQSAVTHKPVIEPPEYESIIIINVHNQSKIQESQNTLQYNLLTEYTQFVWHFGAIWTILSI